MKTKNLFFAALMLLSMSVLAGNNDTLTTTTASAVDVKMAKMSQILIKPESNNLIGVYAAVPEKTELGVKVWDSNGDLIQKHWFGKYDSLVVGIDIALLPAGSYTFELIDGNGSIYTKTLVKE